MNPEITRDFVCKAYQELLGRLPESEETILAYRNLEHPDDVRRIIVSSEEYAARQLAAAKGADVSAGVQPDAESTASGPQQASLFTYRHSAQTGSAKATLKYSQKMAFLGDDQAKMLARIVNAISSSVYAKSFAYSGGFIQKLKSDGSLSQELDSFDVIWFQPNLRVVEFISNQHVDFQQKCRALAKIEFDAFHPDCTVVTYQGVPLAGPTGLYHSALVFWGFINGLTQHQVMDLFRLPVFRLLGYLNREEMAISEIRQMDLRHETDLLRCLAKWRSRGVWMHAPDRPKSFVLADVAKHCLELYNESHFPGGADCVEDLLADDAGWPVYPSIAAHFGLEGGYAFKISRARADPERPVQHLSLNQFVAASFVLYGALDPAYLHCERLTNPMFRSLQAWHESGSYEKRNFAIFDLGAPRYRLTLDDQSIWRKAVSADDPQAVDPIRVPRFKILSDYKVSALGGCFSQLLRRMRPHWSTPQLDNARTGTVSITRSDFNSSDGAMVHSVKQLLQLFELAFEVRQPSDVGWMNSDGAYIDPIRFSSNLVCFSSEADMLRARKRMLEHFAASVRTSDVMVITLQQTPVFRRRHDGLIVNYTPDVQMHDLHQGVYDHLSPSIKDVMDDMALVVRGMKAVNPKIKLLFAVGVAPIVATFDDQTALVSNAATKSALTVVFQELRRDHDWIDYFPSYELLTGAFSRGMYLQGDLRTTSDLGLSRLWEVFNKHFFSGEAEPIMLIHH